MFTRWRHLLPPLGSLLLLQTAACSTGDEQHGGEATPVDTSSIDEARPDAADKSGTGADMAEQNDDALPAPPESTSPIRFLALGDGGEGNEAQYRVGAAAARVCQERGCDFALYLGDNFYNNGVLSSEDEQFSTKFELPYKDLPIPFYVVLGNHDYGEEGLGIPDSITRNAQIEYTERSDKWTLPAAYYTVRIGPVQLFGLDTPAMMWGRDVEAQERWLANELAQSDATWKIAYGHHPYISNGQHGNAGNYDGLPWVPFMAGGDVRDFMKNDVCGKVDLYIAGHDHTRQWLEPNCDTELIVSGAASKTTELAHRDGNPVFYEDDSEPGFIWIELHDHALHGVFYDQDGNIDFEHETEAMP